MRNTRMHAASELATWWLLGALVTAAAQAFAFDCDYDFARVLRNPEVQGDVEAVTGAPLALDELLLYNGFGSLAYLSLGSVREVHPREATWWVEAEIPEDSWDRTRRGR